MDRLKEIEAELEIIRARLEELAEMGEPEEQDEVLRAQILQERDIEIDDLTARWDELMQEREPLLQRARKLDEIREAARNLARTEPGDGRYLGGSGPYFAPNKDPFDADPLTLPRQEVISRAMTVLERERAVEVPDDAKAQVESFMRRSGSPDEGHYQLDGSYIARRLLLTENDAYRSAFQKYVRFGAQAAYTPEEQAAVARYQNYEIQRAMGEANGNTGGFGIPVERELVAA